MGQAGPGARGRERVALVTTLRKILGYGAPYVSWGQLRFPAARPDGVAQLVKLNPDASIETQ